MRCFKISLYSSTNQREICEIFCYESSFSTLSKVFIKLIFMLHFFSFKMSDRIRYNRGEQLEGN